MSYIVRQAHKQSIWGKRGVVKMMHIIRKDMQTTTTWSSGTTTELAIYPVDAKYTKRNFKWRISTATVNNETSIFTMLPGIWRILMVVEGDLYLEHTGHHNVHLAPFEQDQFSGEWETKSRGKATDFNVMLAEGYVANLRLLTYAATEDRQMIVQKTEYINESFEIFYNINGKLKIEGLMLNTVLGQGEMLIVNRNQLPEELYLVFHNAGHEPIHVINATIERRS